MVYDRSAAVTAATPSPTRSPHPRSQGHGDGLRHDRSPRAPTVSRSNRSPRARNRPREQQHHRQHRAAQGLLVRVTASATTVREPQGVESNDAFDVSHDADVQLRPRHQLYRKLTAKPVSLASPNGGQCRQDRLIPHLPDFPDPPLPESNTAITYGAPGRPRRSTSLLGVAPSAGRRPPAPRRPSRSPNVDQFAIVGPRSSGRGSFGVYVDGALVATVSERRLPRSIAGCSTSVR